MGILDNKLLVWDGQLGLRVREDGVLKYVEKAYEMSGQLNHPTQTTEASQPRLKGIIAPNEKPALSNQNGETRYLTHPEISFAADEAWSVTTVLNIDSTEVNYIAGKTNGSGLYVTGSKLRFLSTGINNNEIMPDGSILCGKTNCLHIVADGNGNIKTYKNGTFVAEKESVTGGTAIAWDKLMSGYSATNKCDGTIHHYSIQSGALTPTQITNEYNMLRALYPEIPSVQIGTQTWATSNFEAVATPMGNVIQEMQTAANVEKVTGGDFEGFADTAAMVARIPYTAGDETATWTLNTSSPISGTKDGLLAVTGVGTSALKPVITQNITISAKWYKLSIDYKVNSGTCKLYRVYVGGEYKTLNETLSGSGTNIQYIKATGAGNPIWYFDGRNLFNVQLDNISCEELGWASSQELYDGLIAQGESVQTALEASAMWCYYNNDVNNGAIYGKLFNWFAAKLLQTDIESYNTANPSNTWGWHVPTQAEFTTLQTALGGASVAGGKMKVTGTDYWTTPNTGADNSSGFSALGGGRRRSDNGNFDQLKTFGMYHGFDNIRVYTRYDDATTQIVTTDKGAGYSLRLLKD